MSSRSRPGFDRQAMSRGSQDDGDSGPVRRTWIQRFRRRRAGRTTDGGPPICPANIDPVALSQAAVVQQLVGEQPGYKPKLRPSGAVYNAPTRGVSDLPAVTIEAMNRFKRRWGGVLSFAEVVGSQKVAQGVQVWKPCVPEAGATGPKEQGKTWRRRESPDVENPCLHDSFVGCPSVRQHVELQIEWRTERKLAKEMQRLMDDHRDQSEVCCTARSLLAHCRDSDQVKFVSEMPWGLSNIPEFVKSLTTFCGRFNRSADLYELGSDEVKRTHLGGAEEDMNFFAFYTKHEVDQGMENFGVHVVPVQRMNQSVNPKHSHLKVFSSIARKFELYLQDMQERAMAQAAAMLEELFGSQSQSSGPEPEVAVAAPIAEERQCKVVQSIGVQTDFPNSTLYRHDTLLEADCPLAMTTETVEKWETGPGTDGTYVQTIEPHDCKKLRYCGPGSHFYGHLVRDGGYNSIVRAYTHCLRLADFVDQSLYYPDMAWATLDNVKRFGNRVPYVITAEKLERTTRMGEAVVLLTKEHTLLHDGRRWAFVESQIEICCKKYIVYELALVSGLTFRQYAKQCLRDLISGIMPPLNESWADVRLEHPGSAPTRVVYEALWQAEALHETDPHTIALINRARATALASPQMVDPIETCTKLRDITRNYGSVPAVGGTFGWGFCYSCGAPRPGKFRSRLCPTCQKQNSRLGDYVARGETMCSLTRPVRYPGVVHKRRQEIPLKAAAETTAVWGKDVGVYKHQKKDKIHLTLQEAMNIPVRDNEGPSLCGVGLDGAHPKVSANGVRSLVNAILYRVFKALPADRAVEENNFKAAKRLSPLLLGEFLTPDGVPMQVGEWINSMTNTRRKRALRLALKLLEERGEHAKDWDEIKPFVKSELLAAFSAKNGLLSTYDFSRSRDSGAPHTRYPCAEDVPRLIQAPHDETHLVAGPYLKPLVARLKKVWHEDNWIFYGSVGPDKLNRWLNRIKHCESFFWSDYTAFDATFSESTWEMIEGFYRTIYPYAPLEFGEVLRIWRTPKGKVTLRKENVTVWYQAGVCNCSGRDDTALANALFNGIALSLAFAAALANVSVGELTEADVIAASKRLKISVVGDDSLVGCDFDVGLYADQVVRNLKQFGLVVKAEQSKRLCDVTYLGQMPYPARGQLAWGPTIGRCLYKLFWMRERDGKSPPSWTRGIAQSYSLFRNVPLVYDLCIRVDQLLHGHSVLREQVDEENQVWKVKPTDAPEWDYGTVMWLCERYVGLTPAMISSDLSVISTINRLPAIVHLQSLEVILRMDDT